MSVLIKGIEMPKNCDDCLFDDGVHCMAYPLSENIVYDIAGGKPDWCPLVEITKHGRLIDADAFLETLNPIKFEDALLYARIDRIKTVTINRIKDAPTVIGAEE